MTIQVKAECVSSINVHRRYFASSLSKTAYVCIFDKYICIYIVGVWVEWSLIQICQKQQQQQQLLLNCVKWSFVSFPFTFIALPSPVVCQQRDRISAVATAIAHNQRKQCLPQCWLMHLCNCGFSVRFVFCGSFN